MGPAGTGRRDERIWLETLDEAVWGRRSLAHRAMGVGCTGGRSPRGLADRRGFVGSTSNSTRSPAQLCHGMGSPEYFAGSVVAQPLDETLMGPDFVEGRY